MSVFGKVGSAIENLWPAGVSAIIWHVVVFDRQLGLGVPDLLECLGTDPDIFRVGESLTRHG